MEEQLCRIEIEKERQEYVAKIYSQIDGAREFRHRDLDLLLRELTVELEASFGESIRRGITDPPPGVDEEGGFVDEEKF